MLLDYSSFKKSAKNFPSRPVMTSERIIRKELGQNGKPGVDSDLYGLSNDTKLSLDAITGWFCRVLMRPSAKHRSM